MKLHVFLHIFMSCLVLGCSAKNNSPDGTRVILPWPNEKGEYRLQVVHLRTLGNPLTVKGPAAQVYYQAGGGSGQKYSGKIVQTHVVRRGNIWMATDVESQQALALYAIAERLRDFDDRLGVSDRLTWPRALGFDILIRKNEGILQNNAVYDGLSDLIAVAPFRKPAADSGVPAAVNHGLIAHEHFHAYFSVAMGRDRTWFLSNMDKKFYSVEAIAAVNEGLADFYAATFTGDEANIRQTFSTEIGLRRLDGPLLALDFWESLSGEHLAPAKYANGSRIARWLFRWAQRISPQDGMFQLQREILLHLPVILSKWVRLGESQNLVPADFIELFLREQKLPVPTETCKELDILLYLEKPRPRWGCE